MDMYDLTDLGLDEAFVPEAVPEGEYKLRILEVRVGTDKNGNGYWVPRCEIIDHPEAKEVTQGRCFLSIPNKSNMDEKKLNSARLGLSTFLEAFEVAITPNFNPQEQLPGREAWALLGVETDETYGDQNFVKRWIAPK